VVWLGVGVPSAKSEPLLDEVRVSQINSRLRPMPERNDPASLSSNVNTSFQGSIVLGDGFVVTPDERNDLIARNRVNGERIFPRMSGEDVNTSPHQDCGSFVINFGQMSREEAGRWPELMEILEKRVKPE